jgi:hypothetical protein
MTDHPQPPQGEPWKPRIWAMECPFRKDGTPVLGIFGATSRQVVIVPVATWTRLCAEHPTLATQAFEVGSYD